MVLIPRTMVSVSGFSDETVLNNHRPGSCRDLPDRYDTTTLLLRPNSFVVERKHEAIAEIWCGGRGGLKCNHRMIAVFYRKQEELNVTGRCRHPVVAKTGVLPLAGTG